MKISVGIKAAVISGFMIGLAHAQTPSLLPGEVPPQREVEEPLQQLPEPPPDQFTACVGITDRAKRDACIERETEERNPATKTVPESSERAPANPPER